MFYIYENPQDMHGKHSLGHIVLRTDTDKFQMSAAQH